MFLERLGSAWVLHEDRSLEVHWVSYGRAAKYISWLRFWRTYERQEHQYIHHYYVLSLKREFFERTNSSESSLVTEVTVGAAVAEIIILVEEARTMQSLDLAMRLSKAREW